MESTMIRQGAFPHLEPVRVQEPVLDALTYRVLPLERGNGHLVVKALLDTPGPESRGPGVRVVPRRVIVLSVDVGS